MTTGFVWIEGGKIVGNVTLSPDEGRLDRYVITNVAVQSNSRRQGIARALMQESIKHLRTLNVKTALLNVRPTNPGAVKLYRDLGFGEIETRGEWTRAASRGGAQGMWHPVALRRLSEVDQRAAADLVRAATPSAIQRYHSTRSDFTITWDDRMVEAVGDFFTGQTTRRWALEMDGRLAALLLLRGQQIATPHRVSLAVQPDFRGRVEDDLLAFALRALARFPSREMRAYATSTHAEWIAALEQNGFKAQNVLTLMTLAL